MACLQEESGRELNEAVSDVRVIAVTIKAVELPYPYQMDDRTISV